jgi:hypothetical protein
MLVGSDADHDAAEKNASARTSRVGARPVVVVILAVAIVVLTALAWTRTHQPVQRMCTLAGAIDTPTAASPTAAFDAWWSTQGPAQVRRWSSFGVVPAEGDQPTRTDFTQLSDTSWEWRYSDTNSIGVDVGVAQNGNPPGVWAVTGVNQCG